MQRPASSRSAHTRVPGLCAPRWRDSSLMRMYGVGWILKLNGFFYKSKKRLLTEWMGWMTCRGADSSPRSALDHPIVVRTSFKFPVTAPTFLGRLITWSSSGASRLLNGWTKSFEGCGIVVRSPFNTTLLMLNFCKVLGMCLDRCLLDSGLLLQEGGKLRIGFSACIDFILRQ